MAKKATAVAKITAPHSNVAVMEEMPDYMRSSGPSKIETNFDSSDMVRPSIKLLQATSPQLKDYKGKATPGAIWHTGANISLGEEVVFVIAAAKKKYVLYAPRGAKQPVLARSEDGLNWDRPNQKFQVELKGGKKVVYDTKANVAASGLAQFGSSDPSNADSPPAAVCHFEFLVYLPHHPELGPAVLSLARSQIAPGKRLVTNFETRARTSDIFGCAFMASVVEASNKDGEEFYNYQFSNHGFVPKEFRDMVAHGAGKFKDYRAADEEYGHNDGGRDTSEIKKF